MYIELKSGYADDGPAWIGEVTFSKTGRTIYFNNQSFKSIGGTGISGNYMDLITGDEYWISGVKKDGTDRHWAGTGSIMIQEDIIPTYLEIIGQTKLDSKKFESVQIAATDKQAFTEIENERYEEGFDYSELRQKELHKLTPEELEFMIEECEYDIETVRFNKARRSSGKFLDQLLEEKEKRTQITNE